MSTNGLQTAVLEAGGHIEERAGYPDFHKFVVQYVFTREALEKMLANERERCAKLCEGAVHNADDWDSHYWDQACINRSLAIRTLGSP